MINTLTGVAAAAGKFFSDDAVRLGLIDRRLPHLLADLGDSRAAALYTGPRQKGGVSPINVACALSGQRYRAVASFGTSGYRTDQYLTTANLAALVASPAGTVRIIGALNDIGQDYPTQGTAGATAAANVQAAITSTLRPAGIRVIVEAEIGQDGMAAVRLGQVYEYNQRMREFCERTSGCYWHDARPVVLNQTSSTSTVNYKTGYSYDGSHPNQRGGHYWGKSLKTLLDSITPASVPLIANISELPANGRWQILDNPLFNTTTGGSTSTGATGTFPGSCTVNKTGAGTAVVCTPAAQNTQLAITFGAQSDNARISMAANNANWSIGDWLQATAKITVTNPSGLAGVQMTMVPTVDSAGVVVTDMYANPLWAGPDETFTMTLLTDPYRVTGTTKNSLVPTIYFTAFAAGSAFTASIENMAIIRRVAGYGG